MIHDSKDCSEKRDLSGGSNENEEQFGAWLRVTLVGRRKNSQKYRGDNRRMRSWRGEIGEEVESSHNGGK